MLNSIRQKISIIRIKSQLNGQDQLLYENTTLSKEIVTIFTNTFLQKIYNLGKIIKYKIFRFNYKKIRINFTTNYETNYDINTELKIRLSLKLFYYFI